MPRVIREVVVQIRKDASCLRKQIIEHSVNPKPLPPAKDGAPEGLLREAISNLVPNLSPKTKGKKESKFVAVQRAQQESREKSRRPIHRNIKAKSSKFLQKTKERVAKAGGFYRTEKNLGLEHLGF